MFETFSYACPKDWDTLFALQKEGGRLYAGGTDLLVLLRAKKISTPRVIDVKGLPDISAIHEENENIAIGAACSFTNICNDPLIKCWAPALAEGCRSVGSPQIRQKGTLGGNIQNASPAADGLNAAFGLDGAVELRSERGLRILSIADFIKGPRNTQLCADEIITRILIPMRDWSCQKYFKVGRRNALAISVVNGMVALNIDGNGLVQDARITLGAVAPTPIRMLDAEAMLKGNRITEELLEAVCRSVQENVRPISDLRATSDYRRYITGVSVKRAILSALEDA